MTDTQACILSVGMSPYLTDLTFKLCEAGVRTGIYVNSETVDLDLDVLAPDVEIIHNPGVSIYAEWNDAVSRVLPSGDHLLLLNDDISIGMCTISMLISALDSHPEHALIGGHINYNRIVCEGSAVMDITPSRGRREITNWCVIVRPSMWVPVDDRFRVWYGDDDMMHKLHAAGHKMGILTGVGVYHETSTTLSKLPWVNGAIAEDQRLWAETH